jgi:hypothetical protein
MRVSVEGGVVQMGRREPAPDNIIDKRGYDI